MKKRMLFGSLGLAVAILLSLVAFSVFAKDDAESSLADVFGADTISLSDAAIFAEQAVGGGRAIRAELETEHNRSQWAIAVIPTDGGALKDVEVDAASGEILNIEDEDDPWFDNDGAGDEDSDESDDEADEDEDEDEEDDD